MKTEMILNYSSTDYYPGILNSSNNVSSEYFVGKETFEWTSAEITRLIQIIIRPILIICGTVGNGLSFYVMRRSSLKDVSSCFYMSLLALADTRKYGNAISVILLEMSRFSKIYFAKNLIFFAKNLILLSKIEKLDITVVLWTGCFSMWLRFLTHHQVDSRQWTDCKLHFFLLDFGRHYSSTLLVLMSIEKCFAVYFPLKAKTVCTVKTARWTTGTTGVVLASYNSINFFITKSQIIQSFHVCLTFGISDDTLVAVGSALYSFGPFAIMFITNFAIVFKFMRTKCQNNSTESTCQALRKSATRGTTMVITVSVTFLLLTAPTGVHNALRRWYHLARNHPEYHVFMNLTQYLNHSINGILYCIVGSKFREEVLKVVCRKQRLENVNIINPVIDKHSSGTLVH